MSLSSETEPGVWNARTNVKTMSYIMSNGSFMKVLHSCVSTIM